MKKILLLFISVFRKLHQPARVRNWRKHPTFNVGTVYLTVLMFLFIPIYSFAGEIYINHPQGHGVYSINQPVSFNIVLNNKDKEPIPSGISYEIIDFYGFKLVTQNLRLTVPAQSTYTYTVEVTTTPRGYYDINVSWLSGTKVVAKQRSSYCCLPDDILPEQDNFFGLCSGALFHMEPKDIPEVGALRLKLHQRLGITGGRNDLWWGQIEVERDKFVWDKCDLVMDTYKKYGLDLLGILCYYAIWSPNTAPATPELLPEYADYVKQMILRYGNYVKNWEIWNEPNIKQFWIPEPNARDYFNMLKLSYETVKSVNPEIKVVAMVTSLIDLRFIEEVLSLGGGKYLDVISVHPYCGDWYATEEDSEFNKVNELYKLMKSYGVDVPVWITEIGWNSVGPEVQNLEKFQAVNLAQLYPYALSKQFIKRIYYFNLSDWEAKDQPGEGHLGLMHADYTPKPVYVTFRTLTERLAGWTFVRKLNFGGNIYAYEFQKDKEKTIVVWTKKGTKEIKLKCVNQSTVLLYDIIGTSQILAVDKGVIKFKVSESPVFLLGKIE